MRSCWTEPHRRFPIRGDNHAMPTTSPVKHWRLPSLLDPADGPDAYMKLAVDAETSISASDVTAYTPTWSSTGAIQPSNPASKIGRFRLSQGWCDVYIYLSFNASTSGGSGFLWLSLPVAPSASYPEQSIPVQTYIPGYSMFNGLLQIQASTVAYPYFTRGRSDAGASPWACTDATAAAGTGTPLVPGSYPIVTGGWLSISGRYLVA